MRLGQAAAERADTNGDGQIGSSKRSNGAKFRMGGEGEREGEGMKQSAGEK